MTPPDVRSIVFGVVAATIAHRAGWSTFPLVAAVWWLVCATVHDWWRGR